MSANETPRTEHYSDGRRWSRISKAWIRNESWNDQEEIAYLREELTAVRAEAEALRRDAERLDWLEDAEKCYWVSIQRQPDGNHIFSGRGLLIRDAIDAARSGAEGKK